VTALPSRQYGSALLFSDFVEEKKRKDKMKKNDTLA
jgi:hypothetical protein